jgi:hypothetical protein
MYLDTLFLDTLVLDLESPQSVCDECESETRTCATSIQVLTPGYGGPEKLTYAGTPGYKTWLAQVSRSREYPGT